MMWLNAEQSSNSTEFSTLRIILSTCNNAVIYSVNAIKADLNMGRRAHKLWARLDGRNMKTLVKIQGTTLGIAVILLGIELCGQLCKTH